MSLEENIKEALQKARNLCSKVEKCSFDIIIYLQKKGFDESEISEIITVLKEESYIDDNRYAHHFTNDKYKFNKWGKVKISYNLRQKGLKEINIEAALSKIDLKEYREILKGLIIKKSKILNKDLDEYTAKTKILRYATTKGFEFDLVNSVIEELRKKT